MKIPVVEWTMTTDRVVMDGTRARPSWYKMGLLNALIHFRPKRCLEIGTNRGGSVAVFEHYFREYRPDGNLLTCDIIKHGDFSSARTKQLLVWPYSAGEVHLSSNAKRKPELQGWENEIENALESNQKLITEAHPEPFDFMFLDGDHSMLGVSNDWTIAKNREIPVVVVDDIECINTPVPKYYRDVICKEAMDHYEFVDWPVYIGMGVVTLPKIASVDQW